MTGPDGDILLTAEGLCKSYPGVEALAGVGLCVRRGQVHALVGENGAGKSTLAKVISGLIRPDSGSIMFRGHPYAPAGKAEAQCLGIRMVMQELNLIANLTVAENIFLHHMPHRLGVIRYRGMNSAAVELMAGVGLASVAPDRLVSTLGVGQQQMVEIAAGLSQRCELLILDEPTAALTDAETDLLFEQIRTLQADGVGILYISHRLEEIRQIADTVTVLRNGQLVETRPVAETDTDTIIRWMVGRDLSDAHLRRDQTAGEVLFRVEGLSRRPVVRDVSFEARAGEILGFAGLMGSGRTETMRAIFGADRTDSGRVYLRGSEKPSTIRSPRDAVRRGIALLTEDRKTQALLLPLSVRVNATLTRLAGVTGLCGYIRPGAERDTVDRLIRMLHIHCHSREQTADELSGGNQQKVVIARWIYRNSDVLIFDEPTRGIDVGAKFEIYNLLSDLAGEGKAVIVVSSDLKELLAISDRVAVMSAGKLAATFRRGEWTKDKIMAAALSEYGAQQAAAAASGVPA